MCCGVRFQPLPTALVPPVQIICTGGILLLRQKIVGVIRPFFLLRLMPIATNQD